MPQEEFIGKGSISNLQKILSNHNPKSIFLVTGRSSYEKSGAKKILEPYLSKYTVIRFYDFEVNPKLADIEKGMKLFREKNCDFVIAVGGGSVMDVAKAVNILVAHDGDPADYIQKKKAIENKGKPLAAIPTTSGSGSEATHFAVIYLGKTKYSLAHAHLLPDYALVDSDLSMDLPKPITASSGMDALCQGIESYWCINSNDESKKYAKEAIRLVMKNLGAAANHPSEASREAMSKAAHLAGKAIHITQTTACHAVSYPITSYFNVPHGHAVALTVASMLVYNEGVTESDLLDKRGAEYVRKTIREIVSLLGAKTAEQAGQKITSLMKGIGLATRLSELGIKTDKDIAVIIKNGFNPDRVKNNPRRLTEKTLREILEAIR